MDEATDVAHHEQAAVVVRYVDKNMDIQERLIWVTAVTSTSAENLLQTLLDSLKMVQIDTSKIVAQCYDGAANMSGYISGVQARLKEIQPPAVYVHCFSHCLNLVIVDAMTEVTSIRHFFGSVQSVYNFIESSPHRHAVLESVIKSLLAHKRVKTLKTLSDTRWACRAEAVNSIAENLGSILQALEEIGENSTRPRVMTEAQAILKNVGTFDFVLQMVALQPMLNKCKVVSNYLQSEDLDLVTAVETVASLRKSLLQMRSDEEASMIYSQAKTLCGELGIDTDVPHRTRKVPRRIDDFPGNAHRFASAEEEWKVTTFFQVIDKAVADIDRRFNQEANDLIRACGKILLKEKPTNDELKKLATRFEVPLLELETEFDLFATDEGARQMKTSLPGLLKLLQATGRDKAYKCLSKVLVGFASIPVTSASAERAFSKMGVIKSKLRSTMTQKRFVFLMLISVEQELANALDTDKILKLFCASSPRCFDFGI